MALFSYNPFVGVFRSQKQREAEAALAAQQALVEQSQGKEQSLLKGLGKRQEDLEQNRGVAELQGVKQSNQMYGLRGGTVGDAFQFRSKFNPKTGKYESKPVLRKELEGKVVVLPVGASTQQKQNAISKGMGYVIAPEKFVRGKGTSERDSAKQFYSTVTGRPMGTLMGRGEYKGLGKDATDEFGRLYARYTPQTMERRAARGQNPLAPESTGKIQAGSGLSGYDLYEKMMADKNASGGPQPAQSNIPISPYSGFTGYRNWGAGGTMAGALGFGGMPMFPFAGYTGY